MLAEYIVAKALGIDEVKRLEWHSHDLDVDIDGVKVGVEVKSSAYVQSWNQTQPSVIEFGIGPAKGWNAHTNTWAPSVKRSADVYVFCLLTGKIRCLAAELRGERVGHIGDRAGAVRLPELAPPGFLEILEQGAGLVAAQRTVARAVRSVV